MKKLYALQSFLSGKKTHLCMAVLFVLGGLKTIGVDVPDSWFAMVAAAAGTALRAGISKV